MLQQPGTGAVTPDCAGTICQSAYGRKSVFLQFGHGGRVSVSSFSTTVCPQLVQAYVPVPGFSPVVDIIVLQKG